MSATGLDAAIRRAIDRAQAHDAPARERVYRSARMALEKGIAQRPDLDRETVETQRRRFDDLVRRIEAEKSGEAVADPEPAEAAAVPAVASPGVEAHFDRPAAEDEFPAVVSQPRRIVPDGLAPTTGAETGAAAGTFDDLSAEVRAERPAPAPAAKVATVEERKGKREGRAGRRRKRSNTGRLLSALFLLVSLLVFAGLGLWLLDKTGLLDETRSAGRGANSFTKFDTAAEGMPDLVTEDGFVGAWKPVFVPGKEGEIALGPDATKTPITAERGKAVRLTSATAGPDGDITITIPAELMNVMAGHVSTIALNMRGVKGKPTQIAIECAFGSKGCSRRRFDVHAEMTDVVFKVDLTGAGPSGGAGALTLNTDVEGKGRSVDLFAVGLRRVQ